MGMKEWAKEEVRLACKREKELGKIEIERENGQDFSECGIMCYKSALKAYNSLLKDKHDMTTILFTRTILNKLIDGDPLTPIEDTPEIWEEVPTNKDELYKCKRMRSLFKYVNKCTGKVSYSDASRIWCILNEGDQDIVYYSGLVNGIIDDMFPIEMPYSGDIRYTVFCDDCLVDPDNGDYDTLAIRKVIITEPSGMKTVKINRYFREAMPGEDETYHGWVEISRTTYGRRKKKAEERLANCLSEE